MKKLGNKVITEISDFIKNNISKDYLFIRYMGPKFVIVFAGVDNDAVTQFVTDIKTGAESLSISLEDENIEEIEMEQIDRKKKKNKIKEKSKVNAKLNFVLSTYYKGTGMEEVLKKLEQYIDNVDKNESNITCI